jgi:tyrosine-protein kinase Etk/Wzc
MQSLDQNIPEQQNQNFIMTKAIDKAANASLKELGMKYYKFVPLLLLSVLFALSLAFIKLRYTQTFYKQSSRLYIKADEQSNSNDELLKLMRGDDGNGGKIENEIEVLKSTNFIGRVVDRLNLRSRCYLKGNILEKEEYPLATFSLVPVYPMDSINNDLNFEINFTIENGRCKIAEGQFADFNSNININGLQFILKKNRPGNITGKYKLGYYGRPFVIGNILQGLEITQFRNFTSIINISHQSPTPELSCAVINSLMQEYQVQGVEERTNSNQRKADFISFSLNAITRRIDSIEMAIEKFRIQNKFIEASSESNTALANTSEIDREVALERVKMLDVEAIENILSGDGRFERIPPSLSISDELLGVLIQKYNDRVGIYATSGQSANPAVVRLKAEIKETKKEILSGLKNIKNSINERLKMLNDKNAIIEKQLSTLPEKEREFYNLARKQKIDNELFNFLYQKKFENDISLVSTVPNSKVLETAKINYLPVSPKKRNIYLFALLAGLGLPIFFIYLSELANDKIDSRYEVEKLTQVPIIGEVSNAGDETVILPQNSRKIVAEQLRIVRSNLQMLVKNKEKPTVLITSSVSGEGKSFISLNLANIIAAGGKKVAMFEMDLRRPKISERLKLKSRRGFTNYILGEATKEEILQEVPGYDNLFLVASGPVPPNPSELLLDARFNQLLDYVKSKVDFVVIDTAPVGLISDALILSPLIDGTIYVVRDEYTIKKNMEIINEMRDQNKLPSMAIVINDIKEQKKYGGYKYGGYYYKTYANNYYIEDKVEKKSALDKIKEFFTKKL